MCSKLYGNFTEKLHEKKQLNRYILPNSITLKTYSLKIIRRFASWPLLSNKDIQYNKWYDKFVITKNIGDYTESLVKCLSLSHYVIKQKINHRSKIPYQLSKESLRVLTFKNINFKTSNNIKSYVSYPFLRYHFLNILYSIIPWR